MKTIFRIKNAINILGIKGFLRLCLVNINIFFLKKFKKNSYSQLFEDYFLDKFMGFKKDGFYVDIGANDPTFLNNTKLFYLKGWRGINIEPNVRKYKDFLKGRPNDININMGVGEKAETINFYDFNDDVLSTFSSEESKKRLSAGYKIKNISKVDIDRLENILKSHCKSDFKTDFMSIDTEGFDLAVLKSNDWKKFRPKFICIEVASFDKNEINKDRPLEEFLNSKNYKEVFFNGINSIFVDTNSQK